MTRTLEVAIGLGGTYLFLSIIVLAMVEGVSGWLNRRGKNLRDALQAMLTDGVAAELIKHPLVQSLGKAGNNGKLKVPSYLGPTMFSRAMTDLIARGKDVRTRLDDGYQEFLKGIDDEHHRKHIQKIVGDKVESVEQLQTRLETWFNNSMDRLSGAYKRNTQWFSRGFAVALVLFLNANTIVMARALWIDPEARAAAVKKAQSLASNCYDWKRKTLVVPEPPDAPPPGSPPPVVGAPTEAATVQPEAYQQTFGECIALENQTTEGIPFPIAGRFWTGMFSSATAFLTTVLGLFLSICAVSLGAPFWFDTLRTLSKGIQQTGPKPARDDKK